MRLKLMVWSVLGMSLVWSGSALGDAQEDQFYVSPLVNVIDDDPDRGVDDTETGGHIGIGKAVSEKWNIEFLIQQADLDGAAPQEQFNVGVDFQRVFRRSATFSPYLFVGVGAMDVDLDNGEDDSGASFAGGAGFLLDIAGSPVALRGEYRYRGDTSLDSTQYDNLFSLGLQLPFGSKKVRFVDTDGDGVSDSVDQCPNTPPGTLVGKDGCEIDTDSDGVPDSKDKCPNTLANTPVDRNGCPLDSDNDGVSDNLDQCPGTYPGARVDEQGCELDTDNDGVVDRLDECPATRPGAQVDIKGCEIKDEIRLPGVNFETNSDRLVTGAQRVLDEAAASLIKNPSITVEVQGHTDSDGAADYNQNLSERRAIAVMEYLIAAGVNASRLTARGFGESQPIADNSSREGKAQNRRVVLSILTR